MNWQYTPWIFPLFIPTAISIVLAIYAWKHRSAVGAIPFVVLMLGVAEWSSVYILRLSSATLPAVVFWAKVRYLGIVVTPTAWLIFVLQYTGQEKRLKPRWIALLAIEPLLTLALAWTNEFHHQLWREPRLRQVGSLWVWDPTYGVWHVVHEVYTYPLLLLSIFMLLQTFIRAPRPYRGQAGALLISAIIPLVGDVLTTYDLIPFPLDLTPFAFAVTGLTVAWAISAFRLFDIVPVARNAVVDNMDDAVFIMDMQLRIVDVNPAAENMTGRPASEMLGKPFAQLLFSRPDLVERYRDVAEVHEEVVYGEGESQRSYDLHISPVYDQQGRSTGRLILVHDITERKRSEADLKAQKQLLENLLAMARATVKHPSLEATLRSAVNMAAALTEAEHGSMFLLDGAGTVTHSVLARGRMPLVQQDDIVERVMAQGLAGWVVRHAQPVLIPDTAHDQRWLSLPDVPYVARSVMAAPIVSGSAVLGVLTLTHAEPNHFTPEHAYMIQSSIDQMTLALRNAQMYDEQRRLADHQTTLYEALRSVGQHLDPETIVHTAVEIIARLTGWSSVIILLPDDAATHLTPRAMAGVSDRVEAPFIPVSQGITGRAFRTAQTQYAPDLSADPDYIKYTDDTVLRSELAVPLQRSGRMMGVLDVAAEQLAAFNDDDILLAKSLAETITLALDNAHLYAETRRYTDAIADERSRLRALIESSRDGIILIGMEQRVLVFNAPALDFLRLPGKPEDWVNRPIQDGLDVLERYAPEVVREILREMYRAQKGDRSPGEGEWEVPPHAIHWINLPVMAGAAPLGRLLVLRDVTEERLLEKMRDDLVHAMVHDLRNPLTAIYGALSFLDEIVVDALSDTHRQLWSIARDNTDGLLRLVKSILEISQLESRQLPLEHTPIAMDSLVAEVLDSQLPVATNKEIRLESDTPSDLPPAWADKSLIERVLQNLVSNAIKFTPHGGVVWVVTRLDTAEQPRLLVSISDTGSGIPPEIHDRLFQKFVTGKQRERGSGLGLAFCKMVIEAHGERLWVADTSEKGTTFSFTLPLLPATRS